MIESDCMINKGLCPLGCQTVLTYESALYHYDYCSQAIVQCNKCEYKALRYHFRSHKCGDYQQKVKYLQSRLRETQETLK
jgi:hypothetical protein